MISASHDDKAVHFCLLEPQAKGADCHRQSQPEVELRVSHEASEKPARVLAFELNVSPTDLWRFR